MHASPAFVQFDVPAPERSGKNECVRAIEEAAAYVSRGHRGSSRRSPAPSLDEIVFTGGASHGALWAQILADVLGVPVRVPVVKESTALGAAICAGLGAGIYTSLDDADRLVRFERTVEPDPGTVAAYKDLYPEWLTIVRAPARAGSRWGRAPAVARGRHLTIDRKDTDHARS